MVGNRMRQKGHALMGVRLDSGEMIVLSQQVRRILDEAGLPEVKIFASSGFDEYALERLIAGGARIDAFGVGTRMGVSADAPYLDMVYKMVRLGVRNVRKVSEGKITLAGEKQVFRNIAADGRFLGDVIGVRGETVNGATALLRPAMEKGRPVGPMPTLEEIRARFARNFERLDHGHKRFDDAEPYPVRVSERLAEQIQEADVKTTSPHTPRSCLPGFYRSWWRRPARRPFGRPWPCRRRWPRPRPRSSRHCHCSRPSRMTASGSMRVMASITRRSFSSRTQSTAFEPTPFEVKP